MVGDALSDYDVGRINLPCGQVLTGHRIPFPAWGPALGEQGPVRRSVGGPAG